MSKELTKEISYIRTGNREVYNLMSWLEVTENETQNNVEPWQNAALHAYKIQYL